MCFGENVRVFVVYQNRRHHVVCGVEQVHRWIGVPLVRRMHELGLHLQRVTWRDHWKVVIVIHLFTGYLTHAIDAEHTFLAEVALALQPMLFRVDHLIRIGNIHVFDTNIAVALSTNVQRHFAYLAFPIHDLTVASAPLILVGAEV
ncbi:hypothetical protein N9K47_00245 [bacterium]|nr:hypothetical protein [bacterium]